MLYINAYIWNLEGFPGGSDGKECACNARDLGSISGSGISHGERNGNPLWYSCLEKSHGQRSLEGHSPWVCKELDTTERLTYSVPSDLEEVLDLCGSFPTHVQESAGRGGWYGKFN